jgi:hypothetical protein
MLPFLREWEQGMTKAFKPESAGIERRNTLRDIAEQYRTDVVGVRSRFLAGLELPPAEFINDQLKRQGASWRVGKVAGGKCDFIDV